MISEYVHSPPTYTRDSPDNHAGAKYTSEHHNDDIQYTPVWNDHVLTRQQMNSVGDKQAQKLN